jgi:hypothetical protein
MGWKQCVLPLEENCERIRDGFGLLAAAVPEATDVALFSRWTPDHRGHVLLMSPKAVAIAGDQLSSRWTPCEAPELHQWDLVQGAKDAPDRLGLRGLSKTPAAPPARLMDADGERAH